VPPFDRCDECRRLKEKCEGGTPCKRCKHLRRPCDFNVAPAPDKRVPALEDSLKVMADRMQLMERLLKHHVPVIDLETESLRQACDALSMPSPDLTAMESQSSQMIVSSEPASPISSNRHGIEGEGCTIENVNGAIARESKPVVPLPYPEDSIFSPKLITFVLNCRLLWRVFTLELLDACKTQC
jgi:hypothetical protein